MARHSNDANDELVKAQRRQQEKQNSPRADGGADTTLLSALGNARVQRLMRSAAIHRAADGSGSVDDAVAQTIQSKRGGGAPLDDTARRTLEPSLGADFSDVRVHTDGQADSLNRAVKAEAFTTGKDIFFSSGKYNPGSSDGQKLLAHELTHVVQQQNAPPASEMTVSSPDDASEREAGNVADSFNAHAAPVSRAAAPEEEELQTSSLAREAAPEDELQMSAIAREAAPEEEELQTSAIDRQEEEEPEQEEEEVAMSPIARSEESEEIAGPHR